VIINKCFLYARFPSITQKKKKNFLVSFYINLHMLKNSKKISLYGNLYIFYKLFPFTSFTFIFLFLFCQTFSLVFIIKMSTSVVETFFMVSSIVFPSIYFNYHFNNFSMSENNSHFKIAIHIFYFFH